MYIEGFMLQYINPADTGTCYPVTYELIGANQTSENDEFDVLISKSNDFTLKDEQPHIFEVPKEKQKTYTDFKLTNKGNSGCGASRFHISEIDFYGIAYSRELFEITCKNHNQNQQFSFSQTFSNIFVCYFILY